MERATGLPARRGRQLWGFFTKGGYDVVQLEVRVPALETHAFGVGVDRLSGSVRGRAVKPNPEKAPTHGGDLYFDVSRVSSMSDLQTALGISIGASYGAFGAGISGRFSFMETSQVHTSALFITVLATMTQAYDTIADCELTDGAAKQVDNPSVFAARYGDMFCRAVKKGGIFLGLLQVNTVDSKQARDIEAELKGSYGFFSANAEAKFSDVLKTQEVQSYFRIYQEGGPAPKIQDPTDPIELLRNANAWLQAMGSPDSNWGRAYEWTLAPLEIAEGPLPPNAAEIENAQDVLLYCAGERLSLLEDLNGLRWHLDNPDIFDWSKSAVTPKDIADAAVRVQLDLGTVKRAASNAINHPGDAVFPAEWASRQDPPESYRSQPLPSPMPPIIKKPSSGPVFDLAGVWIESVSGRPGPVITLDGAALTIDMSTLGRPTAHGTVVDANHITAKFPDGDRSYVGTLRGSGVIFWNNDTAWIKVGASIETVLDLNGTWGGGSRIQVKDCVVTVDMSIADRPSGHGAVIAPDTILVYFPDASESFIGKLVPPGTIEWSNHTGWAKTGS